MFATPKQYLVNICYRCRQDLPTNHLIFATRGQRRSEMNNFAWARSILFAITLASLGLTGNASGAIVNLTSGNIIPGTVWEVNFPSSVTLLFNDADKTNGTVGTLIELTSRTNNDPITINFIQRFETTTSGVGGGLRRNFQKTDTNTSTKAWIAYRLELFDDGSVLNQEDASHPPPPHFHPTNTIGPVAATFTFKDTFSGNDLNQYQSKFQGDTSSRDPADVI